MAIHFRQGGWCERCGGTGDPEIEHVTNFAAYAQGMHRRPVAVNDLHMKSYYKIPGLEGAWQLMGLETTNFGEDGKAKLHMVRRVLDTSLGQD